MRKRHKKRLSRQLENEYYYIKIPINENDKYNPVVKVRGIRKFTRELQRLSKQYHWLDHLLIKVDGWDE